MKQYDKDELIKHIQCDNCKFKLETLTKIYDLVVCKADGFPAKKLAEYMSFSIQNTHRLLNILVASGLIKKVNKGDPTGGKLYRYTV